MASLTVAQSLSRLLQENTSSILASPEALRAYLNPVLDYLYTARPTAVNLGTAIKRLRAVLDSASAADGAIDSTANVRELVVRLIAEAKLIADEDVGRNREMSKNGADWLIEELARRGTPKLDEGGKVNVYATVLQVLQRLMIITLLLLGIHRTV